MALHVVLLLAGFLVLIKGADFLVNGSSSLAKKFNISNIAIGLTVVAFGTSTPELIVSVLSSSDGKPDAAFGSVVGSSNFNLLFILGIAGLIYPLVVQRNTVKYELPVSMLGALLVYVLVNDVIVWNSPANELSRWDAAIMMTFFFLFLFYVYRTMRHTPEYDEGTTIRIYTNGKAIVMLMGGLLMLLGGGTLVVDNAVHVAEQFGMSERLTGLTILAIGTSLPELATSAVAAYRKNTDIAIGNVLGANIFNIFFSLSVTAFIHPIAYNDSLNFDVEVLGFATIMLMVFMFTINRRKLDRWEALLLVMGYVGYTIYLVMHDVAI